MSFPPWLTPNRLSFLRIILVPIITALVLLNLPWANWLALAVFLLACLTDYLDGKIARTQKMVSVLGTLLDPIADKMLTLSLMVAFVSLETVNVVLIIVLMLREFAVSLLRQMAASEQVVLPAESAGKYKMILQLVALGFLIVHHNPFGWQTREIGHLLLWLSLPLSLWSACLYFHKYGPSQNPHS